MQKEIQQMEEEIKQMEEEIKQMQEETKQMEEVTKQMQKNIKQKKKQLIRLERKENPFWIKQCKIIDEIKLMADELNGLYPDSNKFIIDDDLDLTIHNECHPINIIGAIPFDHRKLYLFHFNNCGIELSLKHDAFFFAFCTHNEAYAMTGFFYGFSFGKYRKINCRKAFDVLNKFQSYIKDKNIESFFESYDINDFDSYNVNETLISLLNTN